ncbi:hypothetical protein Q764_11710 [Flavobacterium suncheonense GH29-5 = DSM 17707]|uniref:Uncharacterized protein n=1 Tax=Flavobacterium suncheonense GH29-5 = DSM 17707 TaxID=1121899 RepID=A0A0A2MA30_9FLAO|nr:hypothetical protein Q764_11710 [Flavobacterium suncheonense GH29-5 = DSM 17707]
MLAVAAKKKTSRSSIFFIIVAFGVVQLLNPYKDRNYFEQNNIFYIKNKQNNKLNHVLLQN